MERINQTELIKAVKSSEHITTLQPLPQSSEEAIEYLKAMGAPRWSIRVLEMAQDKRHDLAPHTLRYWTEKLKGIPDLLICQALTNGRWDFFPSVDDVLQQIELIREQLNQCAGEAAYDAYREQQREAEAKGLLATEEDYAYMRKRLREIFGDPTARQGGKTS